jgi:signal transduction histidine kinase
MFMTTAGLCLGQGVLVLSGSARLVHPVDGLNSFPIITTGAVLGSLVGALVATRHPRNPIGWLFLVGQLGLAVGLACQGFSYRVLVDDELAPRAVGQVVRQVSLCLDATWTLSVLVAVFLLFPEGRLPSPRWRPVLWAVPLAEILTVISVLLVPLDIVGPREYTGPAPWIASALELVATVTGVLLLPIGVAALVVRRRRATGVERQQLRWLVVVAAALVGGFALAQLDAATRWLVVPLFVAYASVPVAAGIAILRYRLYDIDIVINRTVVGAAVVAFVTVGYVAVVVLGGALVGGRVTDRYGASVLATGLVALAFQPVRGRVRRLGDRVVYGRRAAPYEALAELSRQLADSVSAREVLPVVAETAQIGLAAAQVTVRLQVPGGQDLVVRHPDAAALDHVDTTVPVWHDTERLGEIAVTLPRGRRLSEADRTLLADIATQAGLEFRNTRLAASLAAGIEEAAEQAVQLEASRRRLLAAQESGRQRLARAVRTEVLPHLDSVRESVQRAEGALDPDTAMSLVEVAGEQVSQALEALREIARGVYPPVLAHRGLAEALTDYATRHPQHVDLSVSQTARSARPDRRAQATAYFCAVESVRELGSAAVDLDADADHLLLEVGARASGAGLAEAGRGLVDRVEACGGTVTLHRDDAGGDRVRVSLPLTPHEVEAQPTSAQTALSRSGPNADLGM